MVQDHNTPILIVQTRISPCPMEDVKVAPETCAEKTSISSMSGRLPLYGGNKIDHQKCRYPYCVVWTPIPCLTWLFPFIGHMGIATSAGIIRDFAGPYFVSEDCMGFGNPTKYWQLDVNKVSKGKDLFDQSVYEASEEYKTRMHNLCCDNCHSHVAMAMNLMNYNGRHSYNMVYLCFMMLISGKYVNACGFVKTWLPFMILCAIVLCVVLGINL